jgi:peptidoglycan/LPS O-acetylase OafA/YrhL
VLSGIGEISVPTERNAIENSTPAKPASKSGYIRTLDGWQTIAVVGVIWYHAALTSIRPLQGLQNFGETGVSLFFAISGILICSRLLEERRVHDGISLKGFYLRRVFRIQPAAIAYLLFLALLSVFGVLHLRWGAWTSSLLSYRNLYAATGGPVLADDRYTSHFWSLAVEEHFYLFLPLLIVFAKRKLTVILGFIAALSLAWPPIVHHVTVLQSPAMGRRTDIVVQSLLVAAFLAVLITIPRLRTRLIALTSRGLLIFLTIGLLLLSNIFFHGYFTIQICCFGFPLSVISTVLHPENWLGRLLETRLFTTLGRMSYSLYLWQQLFFQRAEYPFAAYPLHHLQLWPWNLLALAFCAACSYYLIEKPFIRLGHKLAPPATSGRRDLHEHLHSPQPG